MKYLLNIVVCLFFILNLTSKSFAESNSEKQENINDDTLIWCAINDQEYKRCQDWSTAINNLIYDSQIRGEISPFEYILKCTKGSDRDDCMNKIASGSAHLITLDPGEVYIAGKYHSLVPIMMERYKPLDESGYYAVAIIRKNSNINNLYDLRNKKICFSGVGQMAGWILPISRLLDEDIIEVKDCNNVIKTASNFFNISCTPNSLIDKNNPSGDNPQSMCALCQSSCSGNDLYSNFDGALRCLADSGDVTFVKHNTLDLAINYLNHELQLSGQFGSRLKMVKYDYELLCSNGGRSSIDSYSTCNWGFVPAHTVVTTSTMHPEKRLKVQNFLSKCSSKFSRELIPATNFVDMLNRMNKTFQMFGSPPVNMYSQEATQINLLFNEDTYKLVPIEENKQTFKEYLRDYLPYFEKLHKCPVPLARLCVTSEYELKKCNAMVTAFRAQLLKPQLACVLRNTTIECMRSIADGIADLSVFDAGDIYVAGHRYGLVPIVSEKYNLEDSSYYAIAVSKQSDTSTDLLYLKGKRSCHSGYLTGAGWIMPINFLINNNRMRSYGCNSVKASSQFFEKSCAPGSLSSLYTKDIWSYGLLCELCHGTSNKFCSRNHDEPFYGNTGAFRCLVEGGGDIAFIKHTTILENTAGRNPMFWSRNVIPDDFELLCRDGTRAKPNEYKTCNLGKIPANAIVTSERKPIQHIESYVNLFIMAQELYGSKYSEDYTFKMFVSPIERGLSDLIFQDSTTSLVAIPNAKRNYITYLGPEFVRAIRNVDCASSSICLTCSNVLMIVVLSYLIRFL